MNTLENKVALVTGASANLGEAVARSLAAEGASVMVHYNSSAKAEPAAHIVADIQAGGGRAARHQADLTCVAEAEALVSETRQQLGKLDILVNTAGMVIKKPLADFTEAEYDRLFDVNAKAAFFCMREAARHMENEGRVVNIVTTLVGATTGFYAGYAGSKAPVEDFTRALAKEAGAGHHGQCRGSGAARYSFFLPGGDP